MLSLEQSGAKVVAFISDNNRMNQAFFRMFCPISPQTLWMIQSAMDEDRPMFLHFNPVHLIKNLRNNWITEATKTLHFPTLSHHLLDKWAHLEELQQSESQSMVKLSKISRTSVAPSNTEKQNLSLALNVFCEAISSAPKCTHGLSEQGHHLFCDNFHTEVQFVTDLVGKVIRACGTMLVKRKGFPRSLKDVKQWARKSKRGDMR